MKIVLAIYVNVVECSQRGTPAGLYLSMSSHGISSPSLRRSLQSLISTSPTYFTLASYSIGGSSNTKICLSRKPDKIRCGLPRL